MIKKPGTFLQTSAGKFPKSSVGGVAGIKLPEADVSGIKSAGRSAKEKISSIVSKKYGELDTKHLFDGISDKDIENSIPIAENTVKTNLDRGLLSEEKISKLPNLLNGLAVSYAAADKGKSKAATRAREAAYTESNEPLVKSTGTRLLSNDTPYAPRWKSFPEIKSDNTSGSKNEGYVYKPKEEKTSGGVKT